jgi:hypothetical protein
VLTWWCHDACQTSSHGANKKSNRPTTKLEIMLLASSRRACQSLLRTRSGICGIKCAQTRSIQITVTFDDDTSMVVKGAQDDTLVRSTATPGRCLSEPLCLMPETATQTPHSSRSRCAYHSHRATSFSYFAHHVAASSDCFTAVQMEALSNSDMSDVWANGGACGGESRTAPVKHHSSCMQALVPARLAESRSKSPGCPSCQKWTLMRRTCWKVPPGKMKMPTSFLRTRA